MMWGPKQQASPTARRLGMTEGQSHDETVRTHRSLEEAAEDGPIVDHDDAEDAEPAATGTLEREDYDRDVDGVIPEENNDLDPDLDISTQEREQRIAGDETVGGMFQPGGRG
jgi:hypothetical protein